MNEIRVLLVDDHAVLRDGLRALLTTQPDIRVVGEAVEGGQAVEYVRLYKPDVVVMDLAMPGMSGLEATRRIVNERPQTRVLVLTQHEDEHYVLPVCKAGAAGYVLKRSAAGELVRAIRTVYEGGAFLPPGIAECLLRSYRGLAEAQPAEENELLTEREREVLALVAQGKTSDEIGELLHISQKTVMCHRASIHKKLGTHSRAELLKEAVRFGLVRIEGLAEKRPGIDSGSSA